MLKLMSNMAVNFLEIERPCLNIIDYESHICIEFISSSCKEFFLEKL